MKFHELAETETFYAPVMAWYIFFCALVDWLLMHAWARHERHNRTFRCLPNPIPCFSCVWDGLPVSDKRMLRKRRAAPIAGDLDIGLFRSSSVSDGEASGSDHSLDISSALTHRRGAPQKGKATEDTDDDTEFEEMIRSSISRRNVKDGTELLKNTKGKKKLAKGELGGGSFQSMGDTLCRSVYNTTSSRYFFRSFPMDSTIFDAARFPYTHAYPATFHPCPPFQPTS